MNKFNITKDSVGIYLAAGKAAHDNYNIIYQDKLIKRDLSGDMLDIDINKFDFIIATPPCNYYSRAVGNRKHSDYAIQTQHLLPSILNKLHDINKPFIVENVRNYKKFDELGLFNLNCNVYFIGRHTYWTNIEFNTNVDQIFDFKTHGFRLSNQTQGGDNVHNVIESWLRELFNN